MFEMGAIDLLSIIFGSIAFVGVAGGVLNRFHLRKGIGAQFIRYNTLVIALPAAIALALQGMLTEAAASVITGALAYAFAGFGEDEK